MTSFGRTTKTCWRCGAIVVQNVQSPRQEPQKDSTNFLNQLKSVLGRMSSVTDGPTVQWNKCPLNRARPCPSKRRSAGRPSESHASNANFHKPSTHANMLNACSPDTKEKAIRIAGELQMAEQALAASCAKGLTHGQQRSDLAHRPRPALFFVEKIYSCTMSVTGCTQAHQTLLRERKNQRPVVQKKQFVPVALCRRSKVARFLSRGRFELCVVIKRM